MKHEPQGLWDECVQPATTPEETEIDRAAARIYERRYRKPWAGSSGWSRQEARDDAMAALGLSPFPPPGYVPPAWDQLPGIVSHMVAAVNQAKLVSDPFWHLEMTEVFPSDLYARMRAAMPEAGEYRALKGRHRENIQADGTATRVKIDLYPEYIRHLPSEKRVVWRAVGRALHAPELRDAFMRQLAPGLEQRFGRDFMKVGMYPVPMLTRDVAGYSIGFHTDTRWKAITIQLYLPEDDTINHVGTRFDRRRPDGGFELARRMSFSPNTGYAFAVGSDTWHSVDLVGPEVRTRDSILHTYFVDNTVKHKLRNRAKRVGNFLLNEFRHLSR